MDPYQSQVLGTPVVEDYGWCKWARTRQQKAKQLKSLPSEQSLDSVNTDKRHTQSTSHPRIRESLHLSSLSKQGLFFEISLVGSCADSSHWTLLASRTFLALKASQSCYRLLDCRKIIFPSESHLLLPAPDLLVLIQALDHPEHVLPPLYVSYSEIQGWFYHDFPVCLQIQYTKPSSLFTLHMNQCLENCHISLLFFKYTQFVLASLKVNLQSKQKI